MGLTVDDYRDLVRLLHDNPDLRAEIRPLVLSEELLRLPDSMAELAEAQRRTEARVEELAEAQRRTETRVEELAEAQRRTEARVARLEEAVAALTEAQRRTEEELRELAAGMKQLQAIVGRMDDRLAWLAGESLEHRFRERAYSYLGTLLRRVRLAALPDIEDALHAALSDDEFHDLLLSDALVRGVVPGRPQKREVYLAAEVSSVVDSEDVARASRRASLLRRAGFTALPLVAGHTLTNGARSMADAADVVILEDGLSRNWERALSIWAAEPEPAGDPGSVPGG